VSLPEEVHSDFDLWTCLMTLQIRMKGLNFALNKVLTSQCLHSYPNSKVILITQHPLDVGDSSREQCSLLFGSGVTILRVLGLWGSQGYA
jgi:hypothetical protein